MASILLVAHEPLATALQAVAGHAFEESSAQVRAIDIAATATLAEAEAQVRAALADLRAKDGLGAGAKRGAQVDTDGCAEVLVLTDVFGATPCNAALACADEQSVCVVTGVNVSMLWRALCYSQLPLPELVSRAVDGGQKGIMQIDAPQRLNPSN